MAQDYAYEWVGQFEDAEEIDIVERRYVRVLNKRKKYRCQCGACIETAPIYCKQSRPDARQQSPPRIRPAALRHFSLSLCP
jgi:hypothetical protein